MESEETIPEREEIAIIGMAGRFPGASNIDEFWANLRDGVESIRPFTPEELDAAGVSESVRNDPDFVNAGALASDLDRFDAPFFGVTPREAEIMDPQHRVLLETAWEALERAGYDPYAYGGHIGIYGGVAPNTYRQKVLDTRPEVLARVGDYLAMISTEREYAVTRVAFKFNLRGASLSVNTACSTSGVAVHLACQSLLAGENDICLVGGARVRVPLTAGYIYEDDGIPSPDGHCRAFDADARGTVIGSGVGVVVLKRLSEALEDGDWIHAVIKGTAINNDGSAKVGFTAPSVKGQSEVIAEAHAVAGVSADSIDYVEAHGTGTALGDPIEVAAATKAFRETTDRTGFCGIGSLKTNIGHLDAGAGVAALIKTALALENSQIPPSLNYSRPNPQIDFASSPFYVNDRLRPWVRDGARPRRAGISSFGLGGTNAHIVLEEAPERVAAPPSPAIERPKRRFQLLLWSARTPAALEGARERLGESLAKDGPELADVAYTLQIGRCRFGERAALIASSREDAASAIRANDRRRLILSRDTSDGAGIERGPVFLFPGGGAQYVGMGRDLYEREPVFRDAVDRCFDFFGRGDAGLAAAELRELLYPTSESTERRTESERPSRALPLLFSVEYALAQLWTSWGLEPTALLGHSMGEYTAACLAGVVTLEQACSIVQERGRLFEKLPSGSMLGVSLAADDSRLELEASLSIAAINRPGACVVSGPDASIEALATRLERDGIDCKRIHISVAAHSQMVEPILEEFRAFLGRIEFQEPQIPYVSNVSGTWIRPEEATSADYWVRHLRGTVRFADGLATLFEEGERVLLEVGPGQTLSTFARQHPDKGVGHFVVPSMRHPREEAHDDEFILTSLGRVWLAGAKVDWGEYHRADPRNRVPLPTYAFERSRYWIEPDLAARGEARTGTAPMEEYAPTPDATDGAAAAPATPTTRKERIFARLAGALHELTGIAVDRIDPHATFLELGFDSLLLTQANNAFRRELGVRITFRQLFVDTPTLDLLAEFIDGELPDEATVGASPDSAQAAEPTATAAGVPEPSGSSGTHGPWNPPVPSQPGSTGDGDGLDSNQREHLDRLIERFTARTAGSKERTQAHRARLSDPRTAAGFRLPWKELVYPIVVDDARGSKLVDVDGNEWIDLSMGFGVTIFGHSPDFITEAIQDQLQRSIAIGPQTPLAGEVAELVCELTGLERAALCNTGSEAVLAAIRSARTVTGKDRIVMFTNSYHGMFDEVVVKGMQVDGELRSLPVSPGIPRSAVGQVIVLTYGDPRSLDVIRARADEIAAVLVEPIQSRDPELQPADFVRDLRALTAERDVALVFDEMVTGFRVHPGGAQAFYGVQADIATYGKVLGGGMPIGVVAGKARYLDAFDGGSWQYGDDSTPEAGVTWFAGTFVRHPLALAAARAALLAMKAAGPELQEDLNRRTADFITRGNEIFSDGGYPVRLVGFGSLVHIRFCHEEGGPDARVCEPLLPLLARPPDSLPRAAASLPHDGAHGGGRGAHPQRAAPVGRGDASGGLLRRTRRPRGCPAD